MDIPGYFVRQYLTNLGLGFGSLDRQRRNRPAFLEKSALVSLTIRQTLTGSTLNGKVSTFPIAVAELDPVIVAEVVF